MIDNLTHLIPDDCIAIGKSDDSERWTTFTYGVKNDDKGHLPIGSRYTAVISPNPFVHHESPLRYWKATLFEVAMCSFRPKKPLERGYMEVEKRPLTADEVTHFERMQAAHDSGRRDWWRVDTFAVGETAEAA